MQIHGLFNLFLFLVADTQLYKSLCPSVRLSVRQSVRQSVGEHESKSGEMNVLEAFWAAALEEAMTYDSI